MKQVRHQERPASASDKLGTFALDPSRHYVKVEMESRGSEGYVSPLHELLDGGYRLESEDRSVTGHSRMKLLSIDKATYKKRQKAFEDEARWHVRQPSGNQEVGTWERIEIASSLTLRQLEKTLPGGDTTA